MYVICPMAHLIAITFDRLSWKDILTSPVVWKKWTMTVDSKSESNDKESLHRIFFWTDVKEIFYYLIFFSVEECFLNLSADIVEWQNTKIAICIDALAKNCHRYSYKISPPQDWTSCWVQACCRLIILRTVKKVFLAHPTRSDTIRMRRPDHWGWISKEMR